MTTAYPPRARCPPPSSQVNRRQVVCDAAPSWFPDPIGRRGRQHDDLTYGSTRFDGSSEGHQKRQANGPRRSDTVEGVRWGSSSVTRGFPRGPESFSSPGQASDLAQRIPDQILLRACHAFDRRTIQHGPSLHTRESIVGLVRSGPDSGLPPRVKTTRASAFTEPPVNSNPPSSSNT